MPRGFAGAFVACIFSLLPSVFVAAQQPASIVAGTVVSDDAEHSPVRRARVTVNPDRGGNGWSTTTDDAGRFLVRGLPGGRYTVQASKPAWIAVTYGATRSGRPGTAITIAEGQQVQNITMRMQRGGVLTGTVRDRRGQPVPGVSVSALRYTYSPLTGERILGAAGAGVQATTDDRGSYRTYGLLPGDYVVVATLRSSFGPPSALQGLRQLTEAEVQNAISSARPGGTGFGTPGGTVRPADAAVGVSPPLVGYAPIFYPGTPEVSAAVSIAVNAGQEHGGIDIVLDPVQMARIDGVLSLPEGVAAQSVQVFLIAAQPGMTSNSGMPTMSAGRADRDGKFTFSGITPGPYTLTARAAAAADPNAGARASSAAPLTLYATANVVVAGRDVSVALTLAPGMAVSGRLVFEGVTPSPASSVLAAMRASLTPVVNGPALTVPDVAVDATGRFAFAGVPSGKYRLSVSQPAGADVWSVKSSVAQGHETLDAPLDIRPAEPVVDWVVTYTDRPTRLSGALQDATGRPAPDYFIIAFSQDRSFWTPQSRRVRQVRPGNDGAYIVNGLPPGAYFVAALTDLEPGEWYRPAFLEQLVSASMRVTLKDGENTTQDLKIANSVESSRFRILHRTRGHR